MGSNNVRVSVSAQLNPHPKLISQSGDNIQVGFREELLLMIVKACDVYDTAIIAVVFEAAGVFGSTP